MKKSFKRVLTLVICVFGLVAGLHAGDPTGPVGDVDDGGIFAATTEAELNVSGDGVLISDGGGAPASQTYLHVVGEDAAITVDRDSTTADNSHVIARFTNNGAIRFRFDDESNANGSWDWGINSGVFYITDNGDATTEMFMTASGNMTIYGVLTENSDVNAKKNFKPVEASEVLAKVLALPLTTWTYKADAASIRHIGPMAQDFYAAFGFGDTPKGLAGSDVRGVVIAAIQGLGKVIEEKETRIQSLEARLAALEAAILKK